MPTFGTTHLAQNAVIFVLSTTVPTRRSSSASVQAPTIATARASRLPAPGLQHTNPPESLDVEGLRVATTMNFGLSTVAAETERLVREATSAVVQAAGPTLVDIDLALDPFFHVYLHVEGVDRFVEVPDELRPGRADELGEHARPGWESASRATLPAQLRSRPLAGHSYTRRPGSSIAPTW